MDKQIQWSRALFAILFMTFTSVFGQVQDDFSDGNFNQDPVWSGDTADFKITNSSAIPPEMKPALQLDAEGADTSIMVLPNILINTTEWKFWVKLSFNTSANNFARVYLVSDQDDLKGPINGYFVQLGGANDSMAIIRQEGFAFQTVVTGSLTYLGNSTNVLRVKVTRDDTGLWKLFSDPDGGTSFSEEGEGFDNSILATTYFGIFCKYSSSNATKFYWDDFYVGEIIVDTLPPHLNNVEVLEANVLVVSFSEAVDLPSAELISNYSVDNAVGNPVSAVRDAIDFSKVTLTFNDSFEAGISYLLNVNNVADITGNIMGLESLSFMINPPPEIPPFSVLINELMVDENPPPDSLPEADYLELYNTTSDVINLEQFTIKPRASVNPIEFPAVDIEPDSFLIIVSTSDVEAFQTYGQVLGLPGFSLNNEGLAVLRDESGHLMHSVEYDDSWYQDDTKKDGGWALEQIDPGQACAGKINWQAAVSPQHGTPGSRNSVDGIISSSPELVQAITLNDHLLQLVFNHWMDSIALTNTLLFSVDNGIGPPNQITVAELDFTTVSLNFTSTFEKNILYTLSLTDSLQDCSGQSIASGESVSFVLPEDAAPFEIVINELMVDPDPPLGLPEFEFVELYNTTDSYLDMTGWSLMIGTSVKPIPDLVILPGEYILLSVDDAINLLGLYGRTFCVPGLGLSNSGADLSLLNSEGQTMALVSYDNSWYGDADKADGGWTLEQIDPFNPCSGKENWMAGINPAGGTPGAINSVDADNSLLPQLEKVIISDGGVLDVTFLQIMDRTTLMNAQAYGVDHGIGSPDVVTIVDSSYRHIQLTFNDDFVTGIVYTLSLQASLTNCTGVEVLQETSLAFGLAENAEAQDVVINEVLFNPAGNGVDFVEIYNRSAKILNLWEFQLGAVKVDPFGHADTSYKFVSDEDALLFSGEYLLLTADPDKVQEQYYTSNPGGFVRMESFPSYSNKSGTVVLANRWGHRLDIFEYTEDMQYPLLNTVEGVSLERINYDRPASDPTNWHSASSSVGYATPAYQNSQFAASESAQDEVSLDPEIFSPDNDGRDDVLNIQYQFASPGFTATILIFDSHGRQVRTLVNHELLGTTGTFSWDGRTNDNQKASIGIYVIYLEVFDLTGHVKKYKKTAVLGAGS